MWSPCKRRLQKLMGTDVVKHNDAEYTETLKRRVQEEYEEQQKKREEELILAEIRRERELVLKGILNRPYGSNRRVVIGKISSQQRRRKSFRKGSIKCPKSSKKTADISIHDSEQGSCESVKSSFNSFNDHKDKRSTASCAPVRNTAKLFKTTVFGDVFKRLAMSSGDHVTKLDRMAKDEAVLHPSQYTKSHKRKVKKKHRNAKRAARMFRRKRSVQPADCSKR